MLGSIVQPVAGARAAARRVAAAVAPLLQAGARGTAAAASKADAAHEAGAVGRVAAAVVPLRGSVGCLHPTLNH